jgi:DUF1707 SHOCT-like domain
VSAYASPDRPDERLSNAERDEVVGHLAAAQAEGRLTEAEFAERANAARSAVTRRDLVPLFMDLPESAPAAERMPRASETAVVPPSSETWGRNRALGGGIGATIMALVPFLALGLFFLFGFMSSFAWSWLFFLLIPIAGIVIYGPGANQRRYRD